MPQQSTVQKNDGLDSIRENFKDILAVYDSPEFRRVVSYLFHSEPEEWVKKSSSLSDEEFKWASRCVEFLYHADADYMRVYDWANKFGGYGTLMVRMG